MARQQQEEKEEKNYLNLELLQENEDPKFYAMNDLCESRIENKELEDSAQAARKQIDKKLKEYVESWGVDGVVIGDKLIQRIESSSGGSWNANMLNAWLTPAQIKKAWSPGKDYSFIKVVTNVKAVTKAREASIVPGQPLVLL